LRNILLYGQPGSGKTTLAGLLAKSNLAIIDGDELRKHSGNFDYTPKGRDANIELAITLASFLNGMNIGVIFALVAPYKYLRDRIKERFSVKTFCLIYNSDRGKAEYFVKNFEYDSEDILIDTDKNNISECLQLIESL